MKHCPDKSNLIGAVITEALLDSVWIPMFSIGITSFREVLLELFQLHLLLHTPLTFTSRVAKFFDNEMITKNKSVMSISCVIKNPRLRRSTSIEDEKSAKPKRVLDFPFRFRWAKKKPAPFGTGFGSAY